MSGGRWLLDRCKASLSVIVFSIVTLSFITLLISCARESKSPAPRNEGPAPGSLELVFTYGSEKEKWIKEVTDSFNREGSRTGSGQTIYVRAIPMGSGESIEEILSG